MEGDVVVVVVVIAVEVEACEDVPPPRDGGGAGARGLALEPRAVATAVHGDDERGCGPPVRLPPSVPLPRFPSPLPPRHRERGRRLCRGLLFPLHRSPEIIVRQSSVPPRLRRGRRRRAPLRSYRGGRLLLPRRSKTHGPDRLLTDGGSDWVKSCPRGQSDQLLTLLMSILDLDEIT